MKKTSRFNVFWVENHEYYVSNTLTRSVVKVDKLHYEILKSGEADRLKEIPKSLAALEKEGFILDEGIDEIGMLRFSHEQSKRATDEIEIVFAPTLRCNFQCTYCFENQRHGKVSIGREKEIQNYIETQILDYKCKKVRFIWFGGEPLLCCDVIERMTIELSKFCKKESVGLNVSIITNGYLLSVEMIELFERVGIDHIQITIDGKKETHDSRRVLHDGKGTYDVILENIRLFRNSSIDVAVRVNLDLDNVEEYEDVKNVIVGMGMENVHVHPALVEKTENHANELDGRCIRANDATFYRLPYIYDYYCKKKDAKIDNVSCACSAEHINSFVIDEIGNVYKW